MSNTAIRFDSNTIPYDDFNSDSKLVGFGVAGESPRFGVENKSALFLHNTYVGQGAQSISISFDGVFTVSFWAKFPAKSFGSSAYGNKFFIILNEGKEISYEIPTTDNSWHHYSIVRDSTSTIILRIDGVTVVSDTSQESLNLMDKSFIGLGSSVRYYEGYDVIVDDIVIIAGTLWKSDFGSDLPSDYIDLGNWRKYLYIIPSTGEVWGYADS